MRLAVSRINKKILLYYAEQDSGKKSGLLVNLQKFFAKTRVDFYRELLNIAHPELTQYIFGEQTKQLIDQQIIGFNQHTSKQQINDKLSSITNQLIDKLQQIHSDNKINELSNSKRREEIVECLRSIILDKPLSKDVREYILSDIFSQTIDGIVDEVLNRIAPIMGGDRKSSLSSSRASIYSEEGYTEALATHLRDEKVLETSKESGLQWF